MSLSKPAWYLCGPINDTTIDGASNWREAYSLQLETMGMEGVDPFKEAQALRAAGITGTGLDKKAVELGLTAPSLVVNGCLDMIDSCEGVILNFTDLKKHGTISVGSPIEMAYATVFRTRQGLRPKPVFILANDVSSSFFCLAYQVVKTEQELFEALDRWYQGFKTQADETSTTSL